MKLAKRLFAVTAVLLAAGCVSVLPEAGPPPQVYRLDNKGAVSAAPARTAAFDAGATAARSNVTVTVVDLIAPRALATDRVAVMTADGHLSYAADARWNERAPNVVQERMLTACEDDPRIGAATRPEDGVMTRYELRLELLRFEAVYADGDQAAPTAVVALRGKLIDRRTRDLVASMRIEKSARASENRIGSIVDAFSVALNDASAEVTDWIVEADAARGDETSDAQSAASAASSSR
jgi:cholesterol transport system auxiliary component